MKATLKKIYYFFHDWYWRHKAVHFPASAGIQTTGQTLDGVYQALRSKIPGAYLRFGDGDVNLLHGKGELLQPASPKLQAEMQEAFSLNGVGIFKCLPLHSQRFGREPGMKDGLHLGSDRWAERILLKTYGYFVGEKIYSHVALAFQAVNEQEKAQDFLRLLKSFNPLFIGNGKVPAEVLEKLFGSASRIVTPPKDAYSEIDRIENEAVKAIEKNEHDYQVVVVAMGCSGRVLEKRLLKRYPKKIFLFDFGSLLDILCGWNTRAWMDLAGVNSDYWKKFLNGI